MDKEIRKVDDVRDDITKIDYEIAELFEKRMGFAAELALSKKQAGESIYNKNKEDEKLSLLVKILQNTQRDNRMPAPAKARTTYCQRFL